MSDNDKNSAQQAEPARIHTNTNREFSMEHRQFSYEGNGYIQDNNFDFDAGLKVSGDFVDDDKDNYCRMIVAALNAAPAPSASPAALTDEQVREAFESWLTDECLNVTYDDALYIWRAACASRLDAAKENSNG